MRVFNEWQIILKIVSNYQYRRVSWNSGCLFEEKIYSCKLYLNYQLIRDILNLLFFSFILFRGFLTFLDSKLRHKAVGGTDWHPLQCYSLDWKMGNLGSEALKCVVASDTLFSVSCSHYSEVRWMRTSWLAGNLRKF